MNNAIEIVNVYKSFAKNEVLHNITLHIDSGEIFGLIGPSGAGKTTLMKLLIGLIKPTKGEISVLGCNNIIHNRNLYSEFGILLDSDGLYDRLTCMDNLVLYSQLYSIDNAKKRIHLLMDRVGLNGCERKKVSTLSKGMRQRLVLARALLHNPKIVFLDEPTCGLDPATTVKIHELMLDMKSQGITIFLTTHNMNEANTMCDEIALLNFGRVLEHGNPKDICFKHRKKDIISVRCKNGEVREFVSREFYEYIRQSNDTDSILSIHSVEPNLEDVFIELTGKGLA
ncbi:MAG: ABC transporter ATP-binding protein [Catonella sp.]|jgi:ABC-2 type transport system ATP-binding protein|nr:ABC transporter ATP-binding protein [Catonella sp.]MDY6357836.1 ABC transporter ATP-binding protein [Catonella sp.]